MAESEGDGIEKIRLIGALAHEDYGTSGPDLNNTNWSKELSDCPGLSSSSKSLLQDVARCAPHKKKDQFTKDPSTFSELVFSLGSIDNINSLRLISESLMDVGRSDTKLFDEMADNPEYLKVIIKCLASRYNDLRLNNSLAYTATSLIIRSQMDPAQLDICTETILDLTNLKSLNPAAGVASIANLLKSDTCRQHLSTNEDVARFIQKNLTFTKDPSRIYWSIFAIWMITFSAEASSNLLEPYGLVESFCECIQKTKREKIVRISCMAMQNLLQFDWAVEILGAKKMSHTISLWEYEKWREEELYTEIRDLISKLGSRLSKFSNFDRYKRELQSGKLRWSPLHQEKFWVDNYQQFETSEFQAVKQLVNILQSSDSTSLAVACFDIGEFARLHPTGKQILTKIRAKGKVMDLMKAPPNREVAKQALLCYQKMLLGNWREASLQNAIK